MFYKRLLNRDFLADTLTEWFSIVDDQKRYLYLFKQDVTRCDQRKWKNKAKASQINLITPGVQKRNLLRTKFNTTKGNQLKSIGCDFFFVYLFFMVHYIFRKYYEKPLPPGASSGEHL